MDKDQDINVKMSDDGNLDVEIILTEACNFRCVYCYEKDARSPKVITPEVVAEIPDFIKKLYNIYHRPIMITWFGGEPTLQSEVIDKVTRELLKLPYITFFLITNGYNIDKIKNLLLYIRDNYEDDKFITQISYDNSPVQELCRLEATTKSGKEAQKKVLSTIHWLAENMVTFVTKNTLHLDTIKYVDKVYFDYLKMMEDLHKKYGTDIRPMKITLDTNCPELSNEELKQIISDLKNGMFKILQHQLDTGDDNINWLKPEKALCSVKNSLLCIDTDGNLYPCHGSVFIKNKDMLRYKDTIFTSNGKNLFRKNIYGIDLPITHPCTTCSACYCARCNIHAFDRSEFKSYDRRMVDFNNNRTYCTIQKEISKFIYAKRDYLNQKE